MRLCVARFLKYLKQSNRLMIVSKDINPKLDLYYVGALTLQNMENSSSSFDTIELYEKVKEKENEVKFRLFFLSLDWLYVLGAIELADNGFIRKCS